MTIAQRQTGPLEASSRTSPNSGDRSARDRADRHRYFSIVLAASGVLILLAIVIHDLIVGEGAIILGPKSYTAIAFTVILTFAALFFDGRARNRMLSDQAHELHRLANELGDTVTRLQRVNDELEVAREQAVAANRAKTTFLANMSHEIRTPLNGVLGYAQILARDPSLSRRQRSMVETISNSGGLLLALLNDILDLSKIEAGAVELRPIDFDLADLLRGVIAIYRPRADEKGVVLELEGPGSAHIPVNGDQLRLRQVLINLVDNAIKFTDRGKVLLHCEPRENNSYSFQVSDTGIGIPLDVQRTVFEPFQQGADGVRRGGTGLGLAISQRQVELMGGQLDLHSATGRGSQFSFTLSFAAVKGDVIVRMARTGKTLRLAKGQTINALVIERHGISRNVLAGILTEIDCSVRAAPSLVDATNVLDGWRPHVVFAEVHGLSDISPEIVHYLGNFGGPPEAKVIAVGPADERALRMCQEAGFADVLALPMRAEAVYSTLKTHLGAKFDVVAVADDPPAPKPQDGVDRCPDLDELLRDRLLAAARSYSVTELRAAIDQVAQQGPEASAFAGRLTTLVRSYDIDGILKLVEPDNAPRA